MEDRLTSDGGYRYTSAYFDAGGQALTTKIDGDSVLSDPNDFADSRDFLWFMDLVSTQNPARTITWKTLLETLETDKYSSYGYAIATKQTVIENKLLIEQRDLQPADTTLTCGTSLRYNYGLMVQDFGAEPFNRRDISLSTISVNSKVPTGGDEDPNGRNLWANSIGGSTESNLWQGSAFGFATTKWNEQFSTILSLRAESMS